MSQRRINPPAAALWLCNCYSVHEEMSGQSIGNQFGSSRRTLSQRRNYTVAQNQRLPFLKIQAKLQRAETRPVLLPPMYNYSQSSKKRAEPCLAILRPLDMSNRTSGVCVREVALLLTMPSPSQQGTGRHLFLCGLSGSGLPSRGIKQRGSVSWLL